MSSEVFFTVWVFCNVALFMWDNLLFLVLESGYFNKEKICALQLFGGLSLDEDLLLWLKFSVRVHGCF